MPARSRGGLRVMRVAPAVAARGGTTSMTSRGSLPCPGPAVRVVLLVGACAAAPLGIADEAVLLSEQEFYAPLPVVLTASRLAQSLDDAPAAEPGVAGLPGRGHQRRRTVELGHQAV